MWGEVGKQVGGTGRVEGSWMDIGIGWMIGWINRSEMNA